MESSKSDKEFGTTVAGLLMKSVLEKLKQGGIDSNLSAFVDNCVNVLEKNATPVQPSETATETTKVETFLPEHEKILHMSIQLAFPNSSASVLNDAFAILSGALKLRVSKFSGFKNFEQCLAFVTIMLPNFTMEGIERLSRIWFHAIQ